MPFKRYRTQFAEAETEMAMAASQAGAQAAQAAAQAAQGDGLASQAVSLALRGVAPKAAPKAAPKREVAWWDRLPMPKPVSERDSPEEPETVVATQAVVSPELLAAQAGAVQSCRPLRSHLRLRVSL